MGAAKQNLAQPVLPAGDEIAHLLASMIMCFARRPTPGSQVMVATLSLPRGFRWRGQETREPGA
jgi:hypothetical protein